MFVFYLERMYRPMKNLPRWRTRWRRPRSLFERVGEILAVESRVRDRPGARAARRFDGRIAFTGVSFRYQAESPILDGVSLVVEPGQRAAIVGVSGAGKSTLISLIPRLYNVVGERSTSTVATCGTTRCRRFAGQVSLVLQEPVLFRGTIADNIAYGRPSASREDVVLRRFARTPTASSNACRTATTPLWGIAATRSRSANASGLPSPAPSSATRAFFSSTSRQRRLIPESEQLHLRWPDAP